MELQRRQNLLRRREQLAARALELDSALRAQERKAMYERQRLAELRDEWRALAVQQVGAGRLARQGAAGTAPTRTQARRAPAAASSLPAL